MKYLTIDHTQFAYEDKGKGKQSILFLHGWTCDQSHFAAQVEAFSRTYRVITVDLRGHGRSDKPAVDYSIQLFAQDIAQFCEELKLERPLLVGHSMGGTIALEVAARHPDLLSGVVLIDTLLLPDAGVLASLRAMHETLRTGDFAEAMIPVGAMLGLPPEDGRRGASILEGMQSARRDVALSALESTISYDVETSMLLCRVPGAYIGSLDFVSDIGKLKKIWPEVLTAFTLASGHFSMIEVPEQINAMLQRFCVVVWGKERKSPALNPVLCDLALESTAETSQP